MAIDKVTPAALETSTNQPNFRNIIINGDMSISQRATSASSISAAGYHTVDRFHNHFDTGGTWTISQDTDVPTGQGFAKSLKMDCTTAQASPGVIRIWQKFEGQNLQYLKKGTSSAESLTCSFWVKSTKTGTFICNLYDEDNNRINSQSYTVSSSDTWEQKSVTFPGDTTGAFGNDNAASLWLQFFVGAGSSWTSGTLATSWQSTTLANIAVGQVNCADSTSNNFSITGVQLEAGTAASDFEFLPHDVNLQRCYRYCYRINGNATDEQGIGGSFYMGSTSQVNASFRFDPPMRAVPTVTEGILENQATGTAISLGSLFDDNQVGICNTLGAGFTADSGTPFTANQGGNIRIKNNASGFIQFDAEL